MPVYCRYHSKNHLHKHNGCARKMPTPSSASSSTSSSDSEIISNVDIFRNRANYIRLNKRALSEKFPKSVWYPNRNDLEWCLFCLGSKICREIYGEQNEGFTFCDIRYPYRKQPLLSIVLHMGRDRVEFVLRCLHQWFLKIGMKNIISMWMFALLACVEKCAIEEAFNPFGHFSKALYKDCKNYLISCEDWQKPRTILIMDILQDYFLIDTSDSDSDASDSDSDASDHDSDASDRDSDASDRDSDASDRDSD